MPPAFALSQDQTLRFETPRQALPPAAGITTRHRPRNHPASRPCRQPRSPLDAYQTRARALSHAHSRAPRRNSPAEPGQATTAHAPARRAVSLCIPLHRKHAKSRHRQHQQRQQRQQPPQQQPPPSSLSPRTAAPDALPENRCTCQRTKPRSLHRHSNAPPLHRGQTPPQLAPGSPPPQQRAK